MELILTLALQGLGKFDEVFNKAPEKIVELVGDPGARYLDGEDTYWLYEDVAKEREGRRFCPELRLKSGTCRQVNLIPEEVMKKNVRAAKAFEGWTPPAEIKEKPFRLEDTRLAGKSKEDVTEKLGGPDGKKVFNGLEVWVYRKFRPAEGAALLTLFVEFDGDTCQGTKAN